VVCGSAALRGRYYKSRFKAGSFQFASVTAADRPTAPDCATSARMSRLRRIAVSDRYFFVTCNLARGRSMLREAEFGNLCSAIDF
jgi:hypothetical protein